MQKLPKVLIVITVVVVLFIPWTQRSLNPTVGSILLICSLSYGISLIFGADHPTEEMSERCDHRRNHIGKVRI